MGKAGKLDLEMKEILRSFEQAEKDTSSLPLNPPPADEFDRIWTRIQAERELIPDPVPTVKPRGADSWRMFCSNGNEILFLSGW